MASFWFLSLVLYGLGVGLQLGTFGCQVVMPSGLSETERVTFGTFPRPRFPYDPNLVVKQSKARYCGHPNSRHSRGPRAMLSGAWLSYYMKDETKDRCG